MRTRAPIAILVAVTSALAACGGDGDSSEREVVTAPKSFYGKTPSGPVAQGITFEPGELIDAYGRFGISLRAAERGPGFQTLAAALNRNPGARFAPAAPDLGVFTLYVTDGRDVVERLLSNDGPVVDGETPGVEFRQPFATYQAVQRAGENVLLIWSAGEEPVVDERFRRLVYPLEQLGKSDGRADAMVTPRAERACDEPLPAEGACRLFGQTITFAPRDAALRMGDVHVAVDEVERRTELEHEREITDVSQPPRPPVSVRSRRGEFLIVRATVENAGDEPMEGLRAALVVGSRSFQRDLDNEFYVDAESSPFPLDPGASADVDLLFDIPANVAAEAESGGALAVVSSPIESWYTGNSAVAGRLALAS